MLAAVRLHPSVRPGCRQVNTTQVNRVDITSVSSIFAADLELRQQIRLLTQFLKENLQKCVDYIRENYDMEVFTKI